jgi:hypothetical protein
MPRRMVGLLAAVGTVALPGWLDSSTAARVGQLSAVLLRSLGFLTCRRPPLLLLKKNGFKVTLSVVEITHSV